jgi:hypothetical protein
VTWTSRPSIESTLLSDSFATRQGYHSRGPVGGDLFKYSNFQLQIPSATTSSTREKFAVTPARLRMQSHANPIRLLGARKVRTLCHRIARHSAHRFEWTANLNRTDCELGGRILVGISPCTFCYLQVTDMAKLSVAKLYRGFESLPLRQQVLSPEKCRCPFS